MLENEQERLYQGMMNRLMKVASGKRLESESNNVHSFSEEWVQKSSEIFNCIVGQDSMKLNLGRWTFIWTLIKMHAN